MGPAMVEGSMGGAEDAGESTLDADDGQIECDGWIMHDLSRLRCAVL